MLSDNTESTLNTTNTPLGSGATFTGLFERNPQPDVMLSCQTDNSGTLYLDFSVDGINYSTFPVNGFRLLAGIHEFHTAVKGPRLLRVRLVNDSGAQSYLRLYTYFGTYRQGVAPINQRIGSDADAIIVRSVDSSIDLALGRFGGMIEDSKFGEVSSLDAADPPTDVWHWGSDTVAGTPTKTFLTVASGLYIASTSASDINVDVDVYYIDSTGAAATLSVNLNGQTPIDLSVTALDVNRAIVTGVEALGAINVTTANAFTSGVPDDPTTVLGHIEPGAGQTHQALYTVPLGNTMRMKYAEIFVGRASGAAGSADIDLRVRPFGASWIVKRRWHITTGAPIQGPLAGLVFPERTSVAIRVTGVSDMNTNISAEWFYDLVTN